MNLVRISDILQISFPVLKLPLSYATIDVSTINAKNNFDASAQSTTMKIAVLAQSFNINVLTTTT